MKERYPFYVANEARWSEAVAPVIDKYSGEVATHVALAQPAHIEEAIASAYAARDAMRLFPPFARQRVLEHCVARFGERREELARAVCLEAGKPIRDARGEVTRLIDTFKVAAEEAVRIGGEVLNLAISPRAQGTRGFTKLVPAGVCSFITPFNFPLNLAAHKVAPAIAAGCPFVLKPADRTPVSALLMSEILAETDLPKGAFSVLPCLLDHVAPFVEDPRIALLSFTGSGPVGWSLRARAGQKKVVLELGGNAPCIVDANPGQSLEAIVDRLVFGAFYQSGQSCISVQRILIHASLYEPLRDALVARVRTLVSGDPKEETTFLGPMIDEAAAMRLEGWIHRARAHGATILIGGARRGSMLDATLLENVAHDEPVRCEEAFGPVAILERVASFDDALRAANAGKYGLQAGIFTGDLAHAMRAWDELETGGVVIGDVPSFRVDNMPYGGVRGSGVGREGVKYAIQEMSETRLLVLRDAG